MNAQLIQFLHAKCLFPSSPALKKCSATLALTAALAWSGNVAVASVVNVAPSSSLALVSQSTDYGGGAYPARNALDRNFSNFTHTDGEPSDNWWRVDLGALVPIDHVVVHNRGDGCCPFRLSDITISLYDFDNNLVDFSPVLNPGNALGGPAILAYAPASRLFVRYIQVTRKATSPVVSHDGNALSLGEVEIFAEDVAYGQPTSQSTTLAAQYAAGNAVNSNPFDFTHTQAEPTPNWWEVDLGANFEIDSVLLLNRPDCCRGRLRDITVSILDETHTEFYASPLLNPDNALGGGGADFVNGPPMLGADLNQLTGGTMLGRYVRITRTPTFPVSDHNSNVLALAEVQVYGSMPPGVPPSITSQPQSQTFLAAGGTANFTVGAVGTEPRSYFWYKNGSTLLPDQTGSALTLNNVGFADVGSYSVVVSNSTAVVTSTPAQLVVFFVNAARTGAATQSTTDNGGVASRAIDGNTSGDWGGGSVTHTGNAPIDNEWWEVDLGAPAPIDVVHLWFRTGCCPERNNDLRVTIYDDPVTRNPVWIQDVGSDPGTDKAFDVPHTVGQVVRVEHPPGVPQIISLAEVQVLTAQNRNLLWVGGNPDTTWDLGLTANWDPGTMSPDVFLDRDNVTFDNSSSSSPVNLVGFLDPLYLNVSSDNDYAFEGAGQITGYKLSKSGLGTLTLANSADNSFLGGLVLSDSTLVLNPGADAALGGAISGNGAVRKEGANRIALSGASTYSGGTVVNAGTLQVQNNQALGDLNSLITINDGASLDLTSSELWNYTQPIVITGSGANGAGALTKSAPGNQNGVAIRSLTLAGDTSIGGSQDARIDIGRGDWTGPGPSAAVHLDGQGHALSLVGKIYFGILAGAQNLPQFILNTGTTLVPHNDNSLGDATVVLDGGTLSPWGPDHLIANPLVVNSGFVDNQGFNQTYTGPFQINGPVKVTTIAGGNMFFNGNLSGAGAVTKIGGYTLMLGGDNSGFTGSFDTEESNTFFTSETAGSAQADWVLNVGNLAYYQAGDHFVQLGSLNGGSGRIGNNLNSPDSGQATFVIGAKGGNGTFAGQIIDTFSGFGTLALTKVGSGTLTLSGHNTYTGPTTISAGTLEVATVNSLGSFTRNLEITAGAVLLLSFNDVLRVEGLTFDGLPQAFGTWGATGSGAEHIDDAHFQGPGLLVVPEPPAFSSSGLALTDPGTPAGAASITFDTLTGFEYRVVYTDSLTPLDWKEVPPGWQAGTGLPMTVSDAAASGAQRFYRLERR